MHKIKDFLKIGRSNSIRILENLKRIRIRIFLLDPYLSRVRIRIRSQYIRIISLKSVNLKFFHLIATIRRAVDIDPGAFV